MDKLEDSSRRQVAEFLPDVLEKALGSYHRFMDQDVKITAKDFADHHNACKVVIAHIQLLIKLAQWADIEKEIEQNENLSVAITIASGEAYPQREKYKNMDIENDFQSD